MARISECPDCGGRNLVFEPESAQMICQDCGQLFDEYIPDQKNDD